MFQQLLGILTGLFAAFSQSLSYLATRHFVQKRPAQGAAVSASLQLLVLSHVWMAMLAIAAAPFLWPGGAIPWGTVVWPMTLNVALYISGQIGVFKALKYAEASRVSPLMTSKLILSGILVLMYGQPVGDSSRWLTPLQWIGVAMCLVAGISINFTGGRMKGKAILWIAWSCTSFSLSDWTINRTIATFIRLGVDRFQASLIILVFLHLVAGVLALALLPVLGSKKPHDWRDALPFALTWSAAMVGLFTAFAAVGIMLGSILQCTRGFITILLGAVFMRLGHHHIEPHAPRAVIVRRLLAGLLMFAGITLYLLKDGATFQSLFPH